MDSWTIFRLALVLKKKKKKICQLSSSSQVVRIGLLVVVAMATTTVNLTWRIFALSLLLLGSCVSKWLILVLCVCVCVLLRDYTVILDANIRQIEKSVNISSSSIVARLNQIVDTKQRRLARRGDQVNLLYLSVVLRPELMAKIRGFSAAGRKGEREL